jgi:hypothetical protein
MEIITGYTGENHVTSADDASLYRGILGADDYVLDVGNKFAATIIDNNTVRIMDGDLVIQGHQARIRANDYEEVTIDNGTPGQKRNDLIVARYQKNTTTGIESITLEVVKGTPGETATDPEIIQEDLTIGGIQRDYPLYRVSLNGLALESVTSLFTVIPNLKDFMTHQAEDAQKHITESGENANGRYVKFDDGTQICWSFINLGSISITSTIGALYGTSNLTWYLPSVFISPLPVFVGTAYGEYITGYIAGIGMREDRIIYRIVNTRSYSPDNARVLMIAIGRWK